MNDRDEAFGAAAQHNAISAAWEQVDADELVAVLRNMPSKLRNRMLSRLKTPASRVTPLTARLLLTNLARGNHANRFRAADTMVHPLVDAIADQAGGRAPALRSELEEHAEGWGRSIVVLAAVCGLVGDFDRFAGVLAACAELGWLSGELGALAGPVAAYAAEHTQADDGEAEPLEQLWEEAKTAAVRVATDVVAGELPDPDDLTRITTYAETLAAEADVWDATPTVDAVAAAAADGERAAALDRLAERLRRLVGTDALGDDIAEVRAAAERLGDDPELAERLDRFLTLVDAADPAERFSLSRELAGAPRPPSEQLRDAAMVGLLSIAEDAAAEADQAPAGVQQTLLEATDAAGAGTLFAGHSEAEAAGPLAEADQQPGDDVHGTDAMGGHGADAAGGQGADVGDPVDDGHPDAARSVTLTDGSDVLGGDGDHGTDATPPPAAGAAAVIDGETPAAGPAPGDDSPAAADGVVAGDVQVGADPATADDQGGTGDVAPAAEARDGVAGARPAVAADAQVSEAAPTETAPDDEEECTTTLAALVAARRFSLAHHLAAALGQDVRAELFAEAALAEGVRRSASPAAAAMVERAFQLTPAAGDLGSLALRAASAIRVALLDPASQASELLRPILDPLNALPALRAFALAVIEAASQNVALPAAGPAAGTGPAYDTAKAISVWAADTLARPRNNKLFRGVEIWNALTAPDQPVGQVLAAVAAGERSSVGEVRHLCRQLSPRELERAATTVDAGLVAARGAQPIMGSAKQQLLRNLGEVVEQASAWCDALSVGTNAGAYGRLEAAAAEARERLDGLGADGADDITQACLTAAAASLADSIGLLGDGLDGEDLDPVEALDRELTLVAGLGVDERGTPDRRPTLAELVAAGRVSRADAFDSRLGANDFLAAEEIISLPESCGGLLDEADARKALRSREREVTPAVLARWRQLERDFNAARARGRIGDDDATVLGGILAHANPTPDDDAARRDLGRLSAELDSFTAALAEAADRRQAVVRADIDDAISGGDISPAWAGHLADLLAKGETGAAEEYLHRAPADSQPPEDVSAVHGPDEAMGTILAAHPAGVTPDVLTALRAGKDTDVLGFSRLDPAVRASVADALNAWASFVAGEHPANLDEPLGKVLRLLGLIPRAVQRPPALRGVSSTGYWFVEIEGDHAGYAYVPDYGSKSHNRRRFMLCWEQLPVGQLWSLARSHAIDNEPIYVLFFGTLSARARVELAAHARRANGKGVVVIDSTVVLRCAAEGRQSYDVAMRAVLPYAAPNPYDPEMLAGIPPEMFYGRRRERESLKDFHGTSIISGGRRFGKTALLRSALGELSRSDPDLVGVFIGIQDVAAGANANPGELWPRVAAQLAEVDVLPATVDPTADGVCAGIRAWLDANERKRLLLMLDECDSFLRADAGNSFANVARLRDTMGGAEGRFKVVFSGLQHVVRYQRLRNQPLTHFAEPLVIGPLEAAAASELVRRPLHAIGWAIDDAQVDRIVTYCACNPSVIQLTCATLIARLNAAPPAEMAPWTVSDEVVNDLLASAEIRRGVRERLDRTLDLDDRYKLLAYMLAWWANTKGLHQAVPPAELRRMALEWWRDGFASEGVHDVRALCDELVGLGVFAGDSDSGYRMLSPGMVRVIGSNEKIDEELVEASQRYVKDTSVGAAGSRMRLSLGDHRYSPLTAVQIADVVGFGATQLRVVVGSRATRVDAVTQALADARQLYPNMATVEVASLRDWRDKMRAPAANTHLVVVSDMTERGSEHSWDESVGAARRRGLTRTERGTRAAVLITGPSPRWLLRRLITRPDGSAGDLADVAVALRRVDAPALVAWDRIMDLSLSNRAHQRRLLEVTGGWPSLIERVLAGRVAEGFEQALKAISAELSSRDGAQRLISAVGLDPADPDQAADPGLVATFDWLVENGLTGSLGDLAYLMADEGIAGEDDPAEAVAILALLGVLAEEEQGSFAAEPVLARCWRLTRPAPIAS